MCSFKCSKLCVQLIVSLKNHISNTSALGISDIGHPAPFINLHIGQTAISVDHFDASDLFLQTWADWIFISLSLTLSATGPRGSHMPTVCTYIHRPSSLGPDLSAQIMVRASCAILSDPVSNADCRLAITAWVFCQWGYANSSGIIQPT